MTVKIKEYEIYAGIGNSDDMVSLVDTIELDSELEAREYAELCAFGLYNLNPRRDIFEIMEQEGIDEDKAFKIFKEEAKDSVVFFALTYEIDENGNKRTVRHY